MLLALCPLWTVAQGGEPVSTKKTGKYPFVFGVKGGVNLSMFSASVNSESHPIVGPSLGFYIKDQVTKNSFVRTELYFSQQGQKDNHLYPYGAGPSIGITTTKMNYINIPFMVEYGKKLSFQSGFQFGLLLSGREEGDVASTRVNNDARDFMKSGDFSYVVGVAYSMEHLNFGVRFNGGINNIYKPKKDPSSPQESIEVHNRVFHFYVGYSF
jgi:hypothetical protein